MYVADVLEVVKPIEMDLLHKKRQQQRKWKKRYAFKSNTNNCHSGFLNAHVNDEQRTHTQTQIAFNFYDIII